MLSVFIGGAVYTYARVPYSRLSSLPVLFIDFYPLKKFGPDRALSFPLLTSKGISDSMFFSVSKILQKRSDRKFSSYSCTVIGKLRASLHIREVPGLPVNSVLIPTQRDLNCAWIILSLSRAVTLPLLLGIYCNGL